MCDLFFNYMYVLVLKWVCIDVSPTSKNLQPATSELLLKPDMPFSFTLHKHFNSYMLNLLSTHTHVNIILKNTFPNLRDLKLNSFLYSCRLGDHLTS